MNNVPPKMSMSSSPEPVSLLKGHCRWDEVTDLEMRTSPLWVQCNHRVHMTEAGGSESEGDVREAEVGGMRAVSRGWGRLGDAASRKNWPCRHLVCRLMKLILVF